MTEILQNVQVFARRRRRRRRRQSYDNTSSFSSKTAELTRNTALPWYRIKAELHKMTTQNDTSSKTESNNEEKL